MDRVSNVGLGTFGFAVRSDLVAVVGFAFLSGIFLNLYFSLLLLVFNSTLIFSYDISLNICNA